MTVFFPKSMVSSIFDWLKDHGYRPLQGYWGYEEGARVFWWTLSGPIKWL